jgi:hypothetical protein
MKRHSILLVLMLTATSLLVSACGPVAHPEYSTWAQGQSTPPHMRVVWLENPAHEMAISWTTRGSKSNVVYYDTEPREGDLDAYAFKSEANLSGTYEDQDPYYHHAFLTNLESSTTYYFTVVSDDRVSHEYHVVTAPDDDTPFKLMYGGDSRSDRDARQQINRKLSEHFEDDPSILALVHGGDFVVDGDDFELWNHWLQDYQLTTTSDGRVLPIIPTRGNHEGDGMFYNEVFAFPGGTNDDFFRTQVGDRVSLITLDTNSSMAGQQRDWLAEQLGHSQSSRWVLTSYHRPAYPAVKSAGEARRLWVPLFEQSDVDLALESDGHAYKRTMPIRNEQHAEDGVVYVGEGGLGVGQRTPKDRWYLRSPGNASSRHHFQVLTFSAEELKYEAFDIDGRRFDSYSRAPRDRLQRADTARADSGPSD